MEAQNKVTNPFPSTQKYVIPITKPDQSLWRIRKFLKSFNLFFLVGRHSLRDEHRSSGVGQGNLSRGIVKCSDAARSVIQVCQKALLDNLGTILFTYKLCVTEKRTYVNKIEIPCLLTVLLSVPINKLLWRRSSETPKNPIFDRRHEKVLHPNIRYNQKNIRMYRINRPKVMFKSYITTLN